MQTVEIIPIVFVGILGFIAIWLLVCRLISSASGWHILGQLYPDHDPPAEPLWETQSGRMRGARYKGCLTLHTSVRGLHLRVHPALFIPWSHITLEPATGPHKNDIGPDQTLMTFASATDIPLRINQTLGQRIAQAKTGT